MGKFSSRDIIITATSNGKQKVIQDLHIEIETLRTLSGVPNTCTVTVFNLSQESRDFFTSLYEDDGTATMIMEVLVDTAVIFSGEVVNASSTFKSPEWITTLYGNEGYNAYRANAEPKKVQANTRGAMVEEIVKDTLGFATSISDSLRGCADKSLAKSILSGGNLTANVKKLIDDCLPDGGDVFIDGEEVVVLAKGDVRPYSENFTQFLEPPVINEVGAQCKILFYPGVKVGGTMTLEAKSYNRSFGNLTTNRPKKSRFSGEGTYKIVEVIDKVDNYTEAVAMTEIKGIFVDA